MTTVVIFDYPKFSANAGMICRTADLYGAKSFIISNPNRIDTGKLTGDTANAWQRMGKTAYSLEYAIDLAIADIKSDGGKFYEVVAVEKVLEIENYRQVRTFDNPNTIFVFGSEDHGLTDEKLRLCDGVFTIDTVKNWSMNVANSAAIALDRHYRRN